MKNTLLRTLCIAITLLPSALDAQEARLLRFPAIHGDNVAFTYAGDLYTVPATGGVARRLTSDAGYEMFAKYSPDGKTLAFTGQYDGNTEVFVMPSEGGIPRRITVTPTLSRDDVSDRMGPNNIVMGWKGNGEIVFRSRMKEWNSFKGQLFTVPVTGGLAQQLPLPRGGFCSFSPDGKKLAYNRVFREFRTWKRYRGGQADDVWVYDFETKTTVNIANNPAQDIIPMWAGNNRIYYISDRGPEVRMNLYSYDLTTRETKRLTDFTDYDIKYPSIGDKAIVFENGGYIYRFDLTTERAVKLTIQILEDLDGGRGGLVSAAKSISNYEISPDGKRALFGARGDVFTVPANDGITRNITASPGVHERNSKWSPDGKWISYVSDETGEDEIWIAPQDGKGQPVQITKNADTYKYQPEWSPDSKKLIWADKKLRLNIVDIESNNVTIADTDELWEFSEYVWAPGSKWIAYTRAEADGMNKVYIYSLESGERTPVTEGWFGSGSPAFSEDGKYLFFESSRTFQPRFSQLELTTAYSGMAKLYFVTLAKDTKSLLAPRNDETGTDDADSSNGKNAKKDKKGPVEVQVDLDGIAGRIVELPAEAANYRALRSVGNTLYYVKSESGPAKLMMYDFAKRKETELGNYGGYEISADGKKMLLNERGSYAIISLPKAKIKIDDDEKVNTGDMKAMLDRHAEWRQILDESWRQMKHFFYDPGMHGVDWTAMREKYGQLVPYVNHRYDLTYIIGEMIGELNVGHAYVGGGDAPAVEKIKLGLLGAEISRDASGYYRIDRILPGQNWYKDARSPLTEVGVDVKEGDYIIAIDGVPANTAENIYDLLVDKADKTVELTVNAEPNPGKGRTSLIVPTSDEQGLYYYNWVQDNIKKVAEATGGRVGYIHIPDMGVGGYNEFVKYYYPQLTKEALIIDVRGNGGGFVSPMIIERLTRDFALLGYARNSIPRTAPGQANTGPKVCLMDEFSASDGDIFPYRFRYQNLGPLIGKRSWGGVVGIRGSLPLMDGGFLNRPEFAHYNVEGTEWVMEGKGVEPDIVVDNDPALEYAGIDEQLNRGIEEILKALNAGKGFKLNPPPAFPDKRK